MKKLYPLLFCNSKEELKNEKLTNSLNNDSIIANGFLKGNTIDEAIEAYLGNLLGDKTFEYYRGMLPFKTQIIKGKRDGSIIISPSDDIALSRWMELGKPRALFITKAPKNGSLFIGFNKELTAQELFEHFNNKGLHKVMNECEPIEGELYYIEGNVPFSLGQGVEALEIAANSSLQFDILKFEDFSETLDFINREKYIPRYEIPKESNLIVESIQLTKPNQLDPSELESLVALFVVKGKVEISSEYVKSSELEDIKLASKDLILIPHDSNIITITPKTTECELVRIHIKKIEAQLEESHTHDCEHHHCDEEHHHCDDHHCHDDEKHSMYN